MKNALLGAIAALLPLAAVAEEVWRIEISPKLVTPEALESSVIRDYNGNGVYDIVAFGDSLTRGVGDFIAPGEEVNTSDDLTHPEEEAGYPLRVEQLLGISVLNRGVSGEALSEGGVHRFAALIPQLRPDIVIILEGANDSFAGLSLDGYFHDIQTLVNITRAVGALPVVATIVPPCCNHAGLWQFIPGYNDQTRHVAFLNRIAIADVGQAFENTCDVDRCYLLNLPEGIHPNVEGYDVMGENIIAALLQIDLLAADGATKLEAALQLPAGSVTTRPNPAPAS